MIEKAILENLKKTRIHLFGHVLEKHSFSLACTVARYIIQKTTKKSVYTMAASLAFKVYYWVAGMTAPALYAANMHYNDKLRQKFPNSYSVQLDSYEPASRWNDAVYCAGKSLGLALIWPLVLGDMTLTGFQTRHMRSLICPGYRYSFAPGETSQFYDSLFENKSTSDTL